MKRRTFLEYLTGAIGLLTGASSSQEAIMEKGKAVVCSDGTAECPNGHKTCLTIGKPLVVGSGTYQNPDVAPLNEKVVIECDVCHVLFIKQ